MKKIIISLAVFIVLSFLFLAYSETKQQSPASQNWWVVYFSNPKDESLNFTIENNSNATNFHYETLSDENKLKEGDINVTKGSKKEIGIENPTGKKVTIRVRAGNDSKEIYKNFGN